MPRSQLDATHEPLLSPPRKRSSAFLRLLALLVVVAFVVLALAHAGSFLVVNNPEHADVLVVLEGAADTARYGHALKLMRQGYAPRILMDADVTRDIYGKTEAELVTDFLSRTRQDSTEICSTVGDSTFAEAADVQRCMQRLHANSAIIVTSDFHTRRALSIFQKRLPQYHWTVAAASFPFHDADQYWKHRAWAKSVVDEWQKFLWWKLVDQWRSDVGLH